MLLTLRSASYVFMKEPYRLGMTAKEQVNTDAVDGTQSNRVNQILCLINVATRSHRLVLPSL